MKATPSFRKHLFICTNQREPGAARPSCGQKGAEALRAAVKKAASIGAKPGELRVNASGCLDQCERGVAGVLYPEGRWFLDLASDEASVETLVRACRN